MLASSLSLHQEQLLDSIRVKKVVERKVTKHDEDGIVAVLTMLGRSTPLRRRKPPQSFHEPPAIVDEIPERIVEVHLQQQIIRIALSGIVRSDDGGRCGKHLVEPIEEQAMDDREMARVLV